MSAEPISGTAVAAGGLMGASVLVLQLVLITALYSGHLLALFSMLLQR